MAIDNLNFYSNWLPAGQLTDKYSSQPWCLKSKNLDIFSSSKSVKATAWSEPTTTDNDVIKQDWKLVLKTDWKVYEREDWTDTLVVDPSVNFPVYQVSYNWEDGTYADAQWGTVQDMVAKYEWDELKSFVVYTDRASYTYSTVKYVMNKSFWGLTNFTLSPQVFSSWYKFEKSNNSAATARLWILLENPSFSSWKIKLYAENNNSDDTTIAIDYIRLETKPTWYYYDAQLDSIVPNSEIETPTAEVSWSGDITEWIIVDIPSFPNYYGEESFLRIWFNFVKKEWASTYWWSNWALYVDMNWWPRADHRMRIDGVESDWDYNEYYSYLPVRNRRLVSVWDYGYSESFWMKGSSFQPLYKWIWSWVDVNGEKKVRYDFVTDMGWSTDVSMDIVWMMIWNESVYMIGNMDWNWYIIPCDLTWWTGTPYIAYGCEFKWTANIDYLLYLVGEDRWVSQLWVYNGQEMVSILGWTEEKDTKNLIDNLEQYRFDWKMIEYRDDLVLSTVDNRIFAYWQTYWGKGWVFIHQLPWTITDLKTDWKDLIVNFDYPTARPIDPDQWWSDTPFLRAYIDVYSEDGQTKIGTYTIDSHRNKVGELIADHWATDWFTWVSFTVNWAKLSDDYEFAESPWDSWVVYSVPDYLYVNKITKLQDDTPIRNYNTEWMAEYPIVLWNHLLEKEESDLYASYILPSSSCKLEFWGMANHYHFRTFTSSDNYEFSSTASYKLKWCTWNYSLKYIEKNWNEYTFRLEGDLPIQTVNDMKITDTEWVELISYSEYNHFRKIWEITTDKYIEWEFRFHNLNNKLELPKSYSLQIMVKGKGTANYTPELFAVDLVANQRDRW